MEVDCSDGEAVGGKTLTSNPPSAACNEINKKSLKLKIAQPKIMDTQVRNNSSYIFFFFTSLFIEFYTVNESSVELL